MTSKKVQIYVDDELWEFNVSDNEFQAVITGNEEVMKSLVARESERRSIALIDEEQVDEPKECALQENEGKKESFIWPDQAVLLFLETYRNKEPEFASGLKRHNKIWKEIADEMKKANYNVTAAQCQNKMSGLKRTYKNISDSNKKSGNHASSWAFYSVMESIFGEKAWIEPISIASSDGPFSSCSSSSEKSDESKPKKRRVESILESFIAEIKENKQKEKEEKEQKRAERKAEKENRWKQISQERREMHKDKVQFQNSLVELLAKVIERK